MLSIIAQQCRKLKFISQWKKIILTLASLVLLYFLIRLQKPCDQRIFETRQYLKANNVTFNCEALEAKNCQERYQR